MQKTLLIEHCCENNYGWSAYRAGNHISKAFPKLKIESKTIQHQNKNNINFNHLKLEKSRIWMKPKR